MGNQVIADDKAVREFKLRGTGINKLSPGSGAHGNCAGLTGLFKPCCAVYGFSPDIKMGFMGTDYPARDRAGCDSYPDITAKVFFFCQFMKAWPNLFQSALFVL